MPPRKLQKQILPAKPPFPWFAQLHMFGCLCVHCVEAQTHKREKWVWLINHVNPFTTDLQMCQHHYICWGLVSTTIILAMLPCLLYPLITMSPIVSLSGLRIMDVVATTRGQACGASCRICCVHGMAYSAAIFCWRIQGPCQALKIAETAGVCV